MSKFLIYVDGGQSVCMGHAMRVKTLANALKKKDLDTIFVTSSEEIVEYLAEGGFEVVIIPFLSYEQIGKIFDEKKASGVLVDKFGFTEEEHKFLAEKTGMLVHIDDFSYEGPAQIVINTTLDFPMNDNNVWLVGGEYAIVRECFANKKKVRKEVRDVLITTGYGDPVNIHLRLIENLLKYEKIEIHQVVGEGYKTNEKLNEIAVCEKRLHLYEHVSDLSELMKKCDIAISAAGTTLYELAAAGVPTIAFALYDNQLDNIERVARKKCAVSLGWHEDMKDSSIARCFEALFTNYALRVSLSKNGQNWIDGQGAERCALEIREYIKKNEKNSNCDH